MLGALPKGYKTVERDLKGSGQSTVVVSAMRHMHPLDSDSPWILKTELLTWQSCLILFVLYEQVLEPLTDGSR